MWPARFTASRRQAVTCKVGEGGGGPRSPHHHEVGHSRVPGLVRQGAHDEVERLAGMAMGEQEFGEHWGVSSPARSSRFGICSRARPGEGGGGKVPRRTATQTAASERRPRDGRPSCPGRCGSRPRSFNRPWFAATRARSPQRQSAAAVAPSANAQPQRSLRASASRWRPRWIRSLIWCWAASSTRSGSPEVRANLIASRASFSPWTSPSAIDARRRRGSSLLVSPSEAPPLWPPRPARPHRRSRCASRARAQPGQRLRMLAAVGHSSVKATIQRRCLHGLRRTRPSQKPT